VPSRSDAWTTTTAASRVAARTDRRPVAGGVYDRSADTTFITWAGRDEDNYVQAYDHRAGTWSAPVKVGDGDGDPHNYPTIVQADDGHLLVLRGMHNVELVMARSARPHSIDGEWTRHVIAEGAGATYPMPFKTANGDIFVFIRETVHHLDPAAPVDLRPVKYVRSTDNGRTWHSSQQLTGERWAIAPTGRPDNMNEIYIGQLRHQRAGRGRPERVHIVYTLAGGGPEGNRHDRYHRNLYYTVFTPGDLRFHSADGTDLGHRVDDATQERRLRIVETPLESLPPSRAGYLVRSPDYIQLVGTLAGRTPFVVWMQTGTDGVRSVHAAVWTPGGWRIRRLATGLWIREMEQLGPLTWRVYATGEDAPGIRTYLLRLGVFWRAGPVIDTPRPVQRVEVVTGHRDPARIIATGASGARDVAVADGDIYVAGTRMPGTLRR
jgi:hypothetical protein